MSTQRAEILSVPNHLFPSRTPHAHNLRFWVGRIFGCWHLRLSRPITRGRESYRACLRCGMHRRFDPESWTTSGPFYSPRVERTP